MSAQAAQLRRSTDLIDAFNEVDGDKLEEPLAREVVYTETGTGRRVEGAPPMCSCARAGRRRSATRGER
jgi:hypothetical protein